MPALSGSAKAYKQARAGIARAGTTRSNYFTPIVPVLKINGTARTTFLPDWRITDEINQQQNTATLTVFGFTPVVGQSIILGLGAFDNRLFAGTILDVETRIGSRSFEREYYTLKCGDYTYTLDARIVTQRIASQSASTAVKALMSTYASGFTTAHVQEGLADIEELSCGPGERLSSVLTRIANLIGGYWYVDYYQDLHFFTSESYDGEPETISTASTHEWVNLSHTTTIQDVRTRVYCEGGASQLVGTRAATTLGAASFSATGLKTAGVSGNESYLFVDAPIYGFGASDRVLVDQSLYLPDTGGADYDDNLLPLAQITTVRTDTAVGATSLPINGTSGLPSTSTGGVVIVNNQVIYYSSVTTGGTPSLDGIPASGEGSIVSAVVAGDDVIRPYTFKTDAVQVAQTHLNGAKIASVRVRNDSTAQAALAALDGGDGIREAWVTDDRNSYLMAAARGDAELAMWADPQERVTFESRDPNLRSGKTVTLSVGSLSGTYTIQSVQITGRTHDGFHVLPWRSVTAGGQRFDFYDVLRQVQEGRLM